MRAATMAGERTILDEPHFQSLELLAVQALAEGDAAEAFKLADRRCRILPVPKAHSYVLRGEALYRLGAKAAALADVAKALEVAPDDIAANRRMLAWTDGPQRIRAALAIIAHDRNFETLHQAVRILHEAGHRDFSRVTVFDAMIEGWAVWQADAPLTIAITDGSNRFSESVEPDPFHPLSECGRAVDFCIQRPRSPRPQSISLAVAGREIRSLRVAGNDAEARSPVWRPRTTSAPNQPVTVIVPIYGDYDATRSCLETLRAELNASRHRAVLVDDATPDARIAQYLATLGEEPRIAVLTNARNLGFVGSINRALEAVKQGDVILLNSDTVVPRGFINRLSAAAVSSPDIGTVTPLSNNGEFTSFPIPYIANALPSGAEVKRIDRIAAKVNRDRIIDIPSGIGFCLYITRACLDAVAPLSEDFIQGYLEDADFCLRARDRGFRNVCAPSVYVGHAGSKSFGLNKRSLVVRNLGVLERRFPKHRAECGAFMKADPLRPARAALEREAVVTASHSRLLVTGAGTIGDVARARAEEVSSKRHPILILEVHYRPNGAMVELTNAAGGMPQSLQCDLASADECQSLFDLLQSMKLSAIEILDPANIPFPLVDMLLQLNVPFDIFIADAGLAGPHSERFFATSVASPTTNKIPAQHAVSSQGGEQADGDWTRRWREIAAGARRILVPSAAAEAFAGSVLPHHTLERIGPSAAWHRTTPKRRHTAHHLGLVPVRSCAHEQWLMREIAHALRAAGPDIAMTVIGATIDDIGLMRSSNTFVTGAIKADEFGQVIDRLGVERLFLCITQPLFGHPLPAAAFSSDRPTAYFDWFADRIKADQNDLPVDPRLSFAELAGLLSRWMLEP